MANLHEPRDGSRLRNQPTGMPLFFERRGLRVVTADPWAFLKHLASERKKAEAARLHAYIDQAGDFFAAAENPRTGSKPLLYYYSFLNLAKVALRLRGVNLPAKLMHGSSTRQQTTGSACGCRGSPCGLTRSPTTTRRSSQSSAPRWVSTPLAREP